MKPTLARAKKIAAKHNCPRCGKPSNPVTNFGKVRATATLLDLVCRYCGNRWSVEYGSTKPTTGTGEGMMSDYRTKELDYDARRKPKTDRSCVCCQRDIKPESKARTVHLVDGGNFALHPQDESAYRQSTANKAGDLGAWLIGIDCARTLGMECSIPE